jgi:hypothetical protein
MLYTVGSTSIVLREWPLSTIDEASTMPSYVPSGCDSQLKNIVGLLTKEDVRAVDQRRSSHRIPLVRPVTVKLNGNNERSLIAFSKNISPQGIGLIFEDALPEGTIATLTIHRLKDRYVHIRSELRWSDPFGHGWFLTGWKFLREVPG